MKPLLSWALLILLPWSAHADNWPTWRGPHGNGHADGQSLPLTWSETENVRWKVPLPGPGNSSPIVWQDRIFITQAFDDKGNKRGLMCFERGKGAKLWERTVDFATVESTHRTNPFCAGSPVTDGQHVVACYGSAGVYCYDLEGKEQWSYDVGSLDHIWGNATTPVLYGNLVILWCSPGERQFLLALDKVNGKKVWQVDVPGGKFGKTAADWIGTWCTPTIARIGNHDELILGVPGEVRGYDPRNGNLLWNCEGFAPLMYTSPMVSADGIVLAFGGFHGAALAVKAGGKGNVTKTHRLWVEEKKAPQRISSPVIVGKHAFLINEPGLAQCFDVETGKDVWDRQRLGGQTWSSPVLAGDRLYVGTSEGEVFVLRADPAKFEILARNELGKDEVIRGSLAVSQDEIFIRTFRHLWCISAKHR